MSYFSNLLYNIARIENILKIHIAIEKQIRENVYEYHKFNIAYKVFSR